VKNINKLGIFSLSVCTDMSVITSHQFTSSVNLLNLFRTSLHFQPKSVIPSRLI